MIEPAFKVTAIDTTGAGDVFRAAFIYGLLIESPPRELVAVCECGGGGVVHARRRDGGVPSLRRGRAPA